MGTPHGTLPFIDNFNTLSKRLGEKFGQVLTVYTAPMGNDQIGDVQLSPTVSVDVMVVHDSAVTLQVRVAHPTHWVLSRQTLSGSH